MKSISIVIVTVTLGIILYFQHSRNLLISQNEQLLNKMNYYESYFNLHQEFEGKFIYEIYDIDKNIFEDFLDKNNIAEDFILLKVDSLDCMSCLDFNIQKIKLLNRNKSFIVVVHSALYQTMIKSELKEAIIFQELMKPNEFLPSKRVVVFLLNFEGKIINFDISDSYGFDLTNYFYHILNRL